MQMDKIHIRPVELLIERRADLEDAMAQHFAGSPEITPPARDRQAARQLFELLIASFDNSDGIAASKTIDPVAPAYYGRFGDALSPILKDVLGACASPSFLSKSVDGFWRTVRARRT